MMEVVRFSTGGSYAAVSGSDGRLRLWETESGRLKQEYVPTSHLSTICTCLEWSPGSKRVGKKKKRKKACEETIAMGTVAGSILFYEVTKAQLIANVKDEHTGRVNGLSWSPETHLLYSCGEDGSILEWDPETTSVQSRWQGGKGSLTAVHVMGDQLLAAGQGITLWELTGKTLITTFSGHSSKVVQLGVIPDAGYFISMGQEERHLKIWSKSERNSLATLMTPEIPVYFHVGSGLQGGMVSVGVTTTKGCLHLFRHKLNGPLKKPLGPTSTLQINDSRDNSVIVPILTCFVEGPGTGFWIGYGSWLKLHFERFEAASVKKSEIITREFSTSMKKKQKSVQAVELMEVPKDVKHLQPGTEGLDVPLTAGKKRKKDEDQGTNETPGELPMEERLSNLTVGSQASTSSAGMSGNNLAHLLSQGLHSKDTKILQSVLSRWDEEVIANTVRSLPVQLLIPLLNEIKVVMAGKGQVNNNVLKWLKTIFQIHSSYLMCCPSGEETLRPFTSLLRTREVLYPQMCQLRGKLQLIRGHIEAKEHKAQPSNEALLVYHDESDMEADDDDAAIMISESEGLSDDDLGVSSSNEESDASLHHEDEKPEDEEDEEMSGSDDDDESTEEVVSSTTNKNKSKSNTEVKSSKMKTRSQTKSPTKPKSKGHIHINGFEGESDPESMDEDG